MGNSHLCGLRDGEGGGERRSRDWGGSVRGNQSVDTYLLGIRGVFIEDFIIGVSIHDFFLVLIHDLFSQIAFTAEDAPDLVFVELLVHCREVEVFGKLLGRLCELYNNSTQNSNIIVLFDVVVTLLWRVSTISTFFPNPNSNE